MSGHDRHAPLLETGPITNAVMVGVFLFVIMPGWGVIKWLARH